MSVELERPQSQAALGTHVAAEKPEAKPTARLYVTIGFILAILTALQVVIVYTPGLAGVMKPLLLAIMAVNFGLAALFYQDLWFEPPLLRWIFGLGLAFGVLIVVSLIVLLQLGHRGPV